MANYFEELNNINVSDKVEKKNGLNYLSWAYAWGELKKKHPTANSKVYEREDGRIYFDDGRTAWVKVSITVNEIEHIEYLPIMDNRNQSIPVDKITSFNVNTSIQRALTKAIGRHGLGLYIYAGEDLPESEDDTPNTEPKKQEETNFVEMTENQKILINNRRGTKAEKDAQAIDYVLVFLSASYKSRQEFHQLFDRLPRKWKKTIEDYAKRRNVALPERVD